MTKANQSPAMPGFFVGRAMSFQNIVKQFDAIDRLPIEIDEVRNAVLTLSPQDRIIFSPEDTDPGKVRGIYYQYEAPPTPYSQPEPCCLIVYSSRLPPEWQRVVCCKELIHIMDSEAAKTDTPDDLIGLTEKLLGPLSNEDWGVADFMAAMDRIALYQALAILFPTAAREMALAEMAAGRATLEQIARWAEIPAALAGMVLSDDWPAIKGDLLGC